MRDFGLHASLFKINVNNLIAFSHIFYAALFSAYTEKGELRQVHRVNSNFECTQFFLTLSNRDLHFDILMCYPHAHRFWWGWRIMIHNNVS